MRLLERTRVQVEIAPRVRNVGAYGGLAEAFSQERMAFRGSMLPQKGDVSMEARGAAAKEVLRILIPGDAAVRVGDCAWVEGKPYIVQSVRRWVAHLELDCEAQP